MQKPTNWWEKTAGSDPIETPCPNDLAALKAAQISPNIQKHTYKTWLGAMQLDINPFPISNGEKNTLIGTSDERRLARLYETYLKEYEHTDKKVTNDNMHDFEDINIGYKLHLNVLPQNVQSVSLYLRQKGYAHKYLSGGEVSSSKVFTVYIGSLDLTRKLAGEISRDLEGQLCMPVEQSEVEFAPNVIGRFHSSTPEFSRYPCARVRGISTLRKYEAYNGIWNTASADITEDAFNKSFEHLAAKHSEYFYGN